MTTTNTEPPPPSFELTSARQTKAPHFLHLGLTVKAENVHPQYLAGWNAFVRQVGHDRTMARMAKVSAGFHPEFRAGFEAARALVLALRAEGESVRGESDPAKASIQAWRARRNALQLQ